MVAKVYTPAEIAEVLRITDQDVLMLINKGDLAAFPVLGQARVSDQALEEFMRRPYNGSTARPEKKVGGQRNRNLKLEKACRERIRTKIREVAPDLQILSRTKHTANGNQLIVCVSTMPVTTECWFGFKEELLQNGRTTFLILGLAKREHDLVIPCDKFKEVIQGLSMDKVGGKKLSVKVKGESYYLAGKGIGRYTIPLDSYVNAFHLLH